MNFSSHAMADLGVQLSWLKFFFHEYEVYVSFMPISTWISFLLKYMFFRLVVSCGIIQQSTVAPSDNLL